MPIDRDRIQRTADKLIRQNKFLAAIEQYNHLLKDTPNDLILINKIGDLYARAGRPQDAVRHFQKIGADYTRGGFFVKAIAIYKKILKLDPESSDSMQRLGDLYARQDLLKEAREMYSGAARKHQARGDAAKAIEIFEKLVRLEPGSADLRLESAEIRRKAGDQSGAREESLAAARLLAQSGRTGEAGRLYREALSAVHSDAKAAADILRTIMQSEGGAAAASLCEEMHNEQPDSPEFLDLLVESFSAAGRAGEAGRVAQAAVARGVAPGPMTSLAVARHAATLGDTAAASRSAVEAVDDLIGAGRGGEAGSALEEMLLLLPGCVPLLTRRLEMLRAAGHTGAAAEVMERLVREYEAAGMSSQRDVMAQALESLRRDRPESGPRGANPPRREPPSGTARAKAGPTAATPEEADFLTEYLAEADVFTRYGMLDKAIEHYTAILARLPGHQLSRTRLKPLLIETGRKSLAVEQCLALAEALAESGQAEDAAVELAEALNLEPGNSAAAAMLSMLRPAQAPAAAAPGPGAAKPATIARPAASAKETAPPPRPAGRPKSVPVSFEPDDEPAPPRRPAARPAPAPVKPSAGTFDLTEGLEASLAESLEGDLPGEPEVESLPEVIAAFQVAVRTQVDAEDYRTHFELGIAYKEMGLLDEAFGELEYASASPAHRADALRLLALCHRERSDDDAAERCYREALDAVNGSEDAEDRRMGLVFELGELLASRGQWSAAREAFAEVHQRDPHYLDVAERLQEASRLT